MGIKQKEEFAFKVIKYIEEYFENKGLMNNIYTLAIRRCWSESGEYLGELWYFRVGNFQDHFPLFIYDETEDALFTEGKNPEGFNVLEESVIDFVLRLNPMDNIDFMKVSAKDLMKIVEDMQKSYWVRWAKEVPPLPEYLEKKLLEEGYEVIRG